MINEIVENNKVFDDYYEKINQMIINSKTNIIRNINLANAGLAIVGFTAAGLAVGSLIDGIVNAVKNKKSS